MNSHVKVEQIKTNTGRINELSELLIKVVEHGASVGFLSPLSNFEASKYWEKVLNNEEILLFAAIKDNRIVGSVQLHLCTKQNGIHRAEIAKLMTHPNFQRSGIGRRLMENVEERAKQEERSLLMLDTREGDPSNRLYKSLGYELAGRIPNYAKSSNGEWDASIFYYKTMDDKHCPNKI
ncbi:GNAT family N-acetyltransferase [Cytobacillus solani]|uniref:GCN5 family acetyltransferase n=1 Tax=Cytobacillus solani TaxID=1637975 RepID=A0A0Q3VI69_9BACI|nr:GNAT family N-acetyltransferase [Cytobacillus solani]KOP82671.1 GCN5 family acetyltransferase [Bacillus sp. FJAT-21945]KQL19683.1 GCN5 family acetyltransferase [Cytobacillus solani]USK52911.1 GNAT family N-acetyltransferase [Cytobacillus solani]